MLVVLRSTCSYHVCDCGGGVCRGAERGDRHACMAASAMLWAHAACGYSRRCGQGQVCFTRPDPVTIRDLISTI
jgi:hypothetical protein